METHKADRLLIEAANLINQLKYDEALTKSKESFELCQLPKAVYFIQHLHIKLHQYDEAIVIGKKGIELLENTDEIIKRSYQFKIYVSLSKAYKLKNDFQASKMILNELLSIISAKDQIESVRNYLKELEEMEDWTADYISFKRFTETYQMRLGDKFYIISAEWFKAWEQFHQGKSKISPGNITNFNIVNPLSKSKFYMNPEEEYTHNALRKNLIEDRDYLVLPEEIYLKMKEKYSPVDYEILRYCNLINDKKNDMFVEVTLRKLLITVLPSVKGLSDKYIYISQKKLIFDLQNTLVKIIGDTLKDSDLDPSEIKLWKVPDSVNLKLIDEKQEKIIITGAVLLSLNDTIEESDINPDDSLIIEFRKKNGLWSISNKSVETCAKCHKTGDLKACSKCKAIKYCSPKCQQEHHRFHKPNCKSYHEIEAKQRGRCGIVGLQNLGNTCFMNSALQCLSHTQPLTQYFLDGSYREDLNYNNPLGTKGAVLARSYSELLEDMWNGTSSVVSPWNFKKVLSVFATQFSGYQQHDSHELLSYLLSGLHEDLNRVKVKKYIEMPDITDKPEQEAASIQWGLFLDRNQSVLVDMIYGQNKSTLVCPICGKISITFDPFSSLTVVVPSTDSTALTLFIMFQSIDKQSLKIRTIIEPRGLVKKIKEYFQEKYNTKFIVYLQEKFLFKGFCPDDTIIESLKEGVIYLYEIPDQLENYEIVPVNFSKSGEKGYIYSSSKSTISFSRLLFIEKSIPTLQIAAKISKILTKVYKDNSLTIPDTIENYKNNPLFKINIQRKSKGICNFCNRKCDGCEFPISDNTKFSEIMDTYNYPVDTLVLETEFNPKAKGIDRLNKYAEENSVNMAEKQKLDINYCMKLSTLPERLDENNKWFCSTCKDHVCASKQLNVYKLPEILILHLLRFKKKSLWTEKITTPIDFPVENFSISSISEENVLYDLYAISNHFGGTGGGHYTAYVKNPNAATWLEMDDTHVSPVSQNKIVSSSAYILFYKRKRLD